MIVQFECNRKINKDKTEKWTGIIPRITDYGTHFEIRIEARSGIMALFGRASRGGFICLPDHGVGCHIANLNDKYWNIENLLEILDEVEALTVAEALYSLHKVIKLY